MTVRKFPCISDAAETDREFYRNLSPAERPEILLELLNHAPEQRHARPRFTGDLDILIRPTAENADRIIAVLKEFGFTNPDISAADFTEPDQVIQLGRPPNRIDLLTSINGVDAEEAFSTKIDAYLDDLPVGFLSKELLIANKRAVGRPQDIADLDALQS